MSSHRTGSKHPEKYLLIWFIMGRSTAYHIDQRALSAKKCCQTVGIRFMHVMTLSYYGLGASVVSSRAGEAESWIDYSIVHCERLTVVTLYNSGPH